ncbi:hypothetical protein M427DRAFT_140679 [Gonapodya prolifera JEL478]|uniref:Uncharacterized protein n=1 Tax=Gonapodya prolifera (strain JEL478) TaxID=1344416 RepID=A0A138ZYX5_GONPJ|nr:hypothetical protein M427DRAFT_140679 [Gonapodya prolifera JEL478]|eukprot:KXS09618.1 hypothetical protein M427DRAFT_140679 [Gonapodya prolifera JEL478]
MRPGRALAQATRLLLQASVSGNHSVPINPWNPPNSPPNPTPKISPLSSGDGYSPPVLFSSQPISLDTASPKKTDLTFFTSDPPQGDRDGNTDSTSKLNPATAQQMIGVHLYNVLTAYRELVNINMVPELGKKLERVVPTANPSPSGSRIPFEIKTLQTPERRAELLSRRLLFHFWKGVYEERPEDSFRDFELLGLNNTSQPTATQIDSTFEPIYPATPTVVHFKAALFACRILGRSKLAGRIIRSARDADGIDLDLPTVKLALEACLPDFNVAAINDILASFPPAEAVTDPFLAIYDVICQAREASGVILVSGGQADVDASLSIPSPLHLQLLETAFNRLSSLVESSSTVKHKGKLDVSFHLPIVQLISSLMPLSLHEAQRDEGLPGLPRKETVKCADMVAKAVSWTRSWPWVKRKEVIETALVQVAKHNVPSVVNDIWRTGVKGPLSEGCLQQVANFCARNGNVDLATLLLKHWLSESSPSIPQLFYLPILESFLRASPRPDWPRVLAFMCLISRTKDSIPYTTLKMFAYISGAASFSPRDYLLALDSALVGWMTSRLDPIHPLSVSAPRLGTGSHPLPSSALTLAILLHLRSGDPEGGFRVFETIPTNDLYSKVMETGNLESFLAASECAAKARNGKWGLAIAEAYLSNIPSNSFDHARSRTDFDVIHLCVTAMLDSTGAEEDYVDRAFTTWRKAIPEHFERRDRDLAETLVRTFAGRGDVERVTNILRVVRKAVGEDDYRLMVDALKAAKGRGF